MSKSDFEAPPGNSSRLREYIRQERESGVHPSVMALRSRPKDRSEDGRKIAEYARIERGYEV